MPGRRIEVNVASTQTRIVYKRMNRYAQFNVRLTVNKALARSFRLKTFMATRRARDPGEPRSCVLWRLKTPTPVLEKTWRCACFGQHPLIMISSRSR